MSEPGSMSLTATLVMAAVVIGLCSAWLVMVFRAAREPARGRRGGDRGGSGQP